MDKNERRSDGIKRSDKPRNAGRAERSPLSGNLDEQMKTSEVRRFTSKMDRKD